MVREAGMEQQEQTATMPPVQSASAASGSGHGQAQAVQREQSTPSGRPLQVQAASRSIGRTATDTLPATDTAAFSSPDSLIRRRADSLEQAYSLRTFAGIPDTSYRQAEASEVFGQASHLAPREPLPRTTAQSLTDNPVFQGMVLLLAATYAVLLFRNLSDIGLLLLRTWRKSPHNDRLTEEQSSSGFSRFLNIALGIGLLFIGIIVVKFGDVLVPDKLLTMPRHGMVMALTLLTAVVFLIIAAFQFLLLRLAGAVTLSQPLISRLVYLKRTFFALTVIVTSPALLLVALCPRGVGEVWFYASATLLTITSVLYLKETLQLFISKKLSILHWFLYLCTVEILPFSLLWFLAVR